jgi:hypothetical protein
VESPIRQDILERMDLIPYMVVQRDYYDGSLLTVRLTSNGSMCAHILVEEDKKEIS